MSKAKSTFPSRRQFLKGAAAAGAAAVFPNLVPGRALGLQGAVAASERITMGFIGIGKMAKGHLGAFLDDKGVQVLAICDVEQTRREIQAKRVEEYYEAVNDSAYKGCADYNDYRELCARNDIDAVLIATPDHWHALPAIEAAKNGKDIYLEKPFTYSIAEGRAVVNAVNKHERILQVGSQQRSDNAFRRACELVRNGRIGRVHTVYVNVGGPPVPCDLPAEPVPAGLDWDFWAGPSVWTTHNSKLAPPESYDGWPAWRDYSEFAGGGMTDWGAHHFDIAQWGLGMDHTGPMKVEPPEEGGRGLVYTYADGTRMIHGSVTDRAGVEWIGENGRIRVNRSQYLEAEPGDILDEPLGENDIRLYESSNHKNNWLDCIRSREQPICPPEVGHRTVTICLIGNIAYKLRRPLEWDPDKEAFVNDMEADSLVAPASRMPWAV